MQKLENLKAYLIYIIMRDTTKTTVMKIPIGTPTIKP